MDDELFEYLLKRPSALNPTPQVSQLYFEIDSCVRILKITYDRYLLLPPIIRKAYYYYFMMRSYLEEEQEKQRKREESRTKNMSGAGRSFSAKQIRK